MEKLDDRVIDLAQRMVIYALETCDVDHNKAFIEGALRSALNSLLLSILENKCGIRELFESAIVQVATSLKVASKIATTIVTDAVVFAPIAKFTTEAVQSETTESAKESVAMASPSSPPSGPDSLPVEEKKDRKKKSSY